NNAASSISGSNYFFISASSSSYLITPFMVTSVAQVTFVARSGTTTAANLVVGLATNATITGNAASVTSTAAGNAWLTSSSYAGLPLSNAAASTFTFIANAAASSYYLKFNRQGSGSIIIDDIVVTPIVATTNYYYGPNGAITDITDKT